VTANLPDVQPGQVWADNDKRSRGRTLRVERVVQDPRMGKPVAVCTVLTNSDRVQGEVDRWGVKSHFKDTRGNTVRIAVNRMRPTATGYRLSAPSSPVEGTTTAEAEQ
jgi:hypothetical protein